MPVMPSLPRCRQAEMVCSLVDLEDSRVRAGGCRRRKSETAKVQPVQVGMRDTRPVQIEMFVVVAGKRGRGSIRKACPEIQNSFQG